MPTPPRRMLLYSVAGAQEAAPKGQLTPTAAPCPSSTDRYDHNCSWRSEWARRWVCVCAPLGGCGTHCDGQQQQQGCVADCAGAAAADASGTVKLSPGEL